MRSLTRVHPVVSVPVPLPPPDTVSSYPALPLHCDPVCSPLRKQNVRHGYSHHEFIIQPDSGSGLLDRGSFALTSLERRDPKPSLTVILSSE